MLKNRSQAMKLLGMSFLGPVMNRPRQQNRFLAGQYLYNIEYFLYTTTEEEYYSCSLIDVSVGSGDAATTFLRSNFTFAFSDFHFHSRSCICLSSTYEESDPLPFVFFSFVCSISVFSSFVRKVVSWKPEYESPL